MQFLAACYQLVQSILDTGVALAKEVGGGGWAQSQQAWVSGYLKATSRLHANTARAAKIRLHQHGQVVSSPYPTEGHMQAGHESNGWAACESLPLMTGLSLFMHDPCSNSQPALSHSHKTFYSSDVKRCGLNSPPLRIAFVPLHGMDSKATQVYKYTVCAHGTKH